MRPPLPIPAGPRRLRARCLAILAGLALGACGDPAPPAHFNTVLHLDPRLEDGRSSAEALALARRTVTTFELGTEIAEADGEGPWRLVGGDLKRPLPRGGVRVQQAQGLALATDVFGLRFEGVLSAADFNAIELDMRAQREARVRISWRQEADPKARRFGGAVDLPAGAGVQTVRLLPEPYGGWHGELHDLTIEPSATLHQQVDLVALRFVEQGFVPGFEPLAGPGDDPPPGDGGIVVHADLGQRTWPSDVAVPLFARLTLPPGARIELGVAAAGLRGAPRRNVDFRVDARPAAGGDWSLVAEGRRGTGSGWGDLSGDLSGLAGQEVELRFSALLAGQDVDTLEPEREPERAWGLFGAPRVLGRTQRPPRPNIVLVTLDTLRADHVLDPAETPVLCRLASEGLAFDEAWSACNATTPSHASILSGQFIVEHGAISNRSTVGEGVTLLAETLRAAGYETAAAVSVGHIQAGAGFGQGFDRFRQASGDSYLDGETTLDPVCDWIDGWSAGGGRPFFLWVHLFDPHVPYLPPDDFLDDYRGSTAHEEPPATAEPPSVPRFPPGEVPEDLAWLGDITNHDHVRYLYRAGVAYTDALMGRLVERLETRGFGDDTALVITADHGEALGEHSVYYGHAGLFPETLRVPLILRVPGGPRGVRVAEPVSTIDIAPTLVALAGLPPEAEHSGVDLLAVGRAGAGDPSRRLWFHYTREKQVGLLDDAAHFVDTLGERTSYTYVRLDSEGPEPRWALAPTPVGTAFLWDPREDPARERNLAPDDPEAVARYREEVTAWRRGLAERRVVERPLTPEEDARLKALGYGGD